MIKIIAMRKYFFLFSLLNITGLYVIAQSDATFREYNKTFTTYPFSNPNPVPDPGSISYPYFRYDGFKDEPVQKEWKVVALENDFIKLIILPQVGGKIWTAIDKKNGKPFIYDNDAIKFRDIAMRGPWTSGGLEANFGIMGHTPGVATPVNYLTRKNADGSVSCVISLLDLLTRTRWDMEINLPKDKAYFITKFFWHNSTSVPQPYYSWMNLGQKVADSLEYIFPGNHYIFHDGKLYDYPINPDNHKNISIYDQNDFGSYKSYHVTGTYSKYFGVLWQKENFGMMHYAERQAKIGKKIWIWGLSRQGMIWEKLLTDHSGQYSEIQSGRLYNQNAPESVLTPFKQFAFAPYNTDTWSEYWYPFQNTDGAVHADLNGVINVKNIDGKQVVFISAVSYINDSLKVRDTQGNIILGIALNLKPLQTFKHTVSLKPGEVIGKITYAGSTVNLQDSIAKVLDRPLEPFKDFNWNSAYGYFLKGKYEADTRHYAAAENHIRVSLSLNPAFIPALDEMAFMQYRKMNYDSAYHFARTALSVNTYDPAANYYYGLAALKLNKIYDAEDGFEVAAITPQYRSAAYTELSKIKLRQKNYKKSYEYAAKSLVNNSQNITALKLQYVSAGFMNNQDKQRIIKTRILELDPLNHFIRFEEYFRNKTEATKESFTRLIRDELPQQTYLDLAIWYANLHLFEESKSVLEACPEKDNEIEYWLAWLHRNDKDGHQFLEEANNGNAYLVFPFRQETVSVMQWANQHSISTDPITTDPMAIGSPNWKSRYYLALINSFYGRKTMALHLLENGENPERFAPFYVLRARLRDSADATHIQSDLSKAQQIDKDDWRYGKYLTQFLLSQKQYKPALQLILPYYQKDKGNYMAGLLYIRCLMLTQDYKAAETVLKNINVLPYEGAKDAHTFYEQTKLNLAMQYLKMGKLKTAQKKVAEARLWPENLGEGAPYPDMVNDTLENEIQKLIHQAKKGKKPSDKVIQQYLLRIVGAIDKAG